MNITPVAPTFTGVSARYRINSKNAKNSLVPFLYNDVLKIVRDYKVPAAFHNEHIDIIIEDMRYQTKLAKNIRKELRTLDIDYKRVK